MTYAATFLAAIVILAAVSIFVELAVSIAYAIQRHRP